MCKVCDAVLRSDYDAVKQAIAAGDNINDMSSGMTPLLWAVYRGDIEAVRLLVESGADPNLHSKFDGSPLWHAEDDFGLFEIAELLKAHGAVK
jgi:ankyrin repeat protein